MTGAKQSTARASICRLAQARGVLRGAQIIGFPKGKLLISVLLRYHGMRAGGQVFISWRRGCQQRRRRHESFSDLPTNFGFIVSAFVVTDEGCTTLRPGLSWMQRGLRRVLTDLTHKQKAHRKRWVFCCAFLGRKAPGNQSGKTSGDCPNLERNQRV